MRLNNVNSIKKKELVLAITIIEIDFAKSKTHFSN